MLKVTFCKLQLTIKLPVFLAVFIQISFKVLKFCCRKHIIFRLVISIAINAFYCDGRQVRRQDMLTREKFSLIIIEQPFANDLDLQNFSQDLGTFKNLNNLKGKNAYSYNGSRMLFASIYLIVYQRFLRFYSLSAITWLTLLEGHIRVFTENSYLTSGNKLYRTCMFEFLREYNNKGINSNEVTRPAKSIVEVLTRIIIYRVGLKPHSTFSQGTNRQNQTFLINFTIFLLFHFTIFLVIPRQSKTVPQTCDRELQP